jgi:hypothetical protein
LDYGFSAGGSTVKQKLEEMGLQVDVLETTEANELQQADEWVTTVTDRWCVRLSKEW